MSIKRVTIELDDSVDTVTPTKAPPSLARQNKIKRTSSTPSGIPDYDNDANEDKQIIYSASKQTGRTFPDLISEFIENPRAMATILMFAPFIIFVSKIDGIAKLKYPIIVGGILNAVWFAVPLLGRLINKTK